MQNAKALLCPSAHPAMESVSILGVVNDSVSGPRIEFLGAPRVATDDLLRLSAPVTPTEVFRLSAKCDQGCRHFGDDICSLASRITSILPSVSVGLPSCGIRGNCRWFHQEGRAACERCAQVITTNFFPSARDIKAASPGQQQNREQLNA